jgi:hypothetical protein
VLVAFGPAWLNVNVVEPDPVIVNTPLNEVSVTPLIPTICPVLRLAAVDRVTVTTLLARETPVIEYVVGLTVLPLLGIANDAGKDNTLGRSGVRLNVVALFMRMPEPAAEVCRTVKLNPGPVVVEGVLRNCQVDCSMSAPTVTGR